MPNKPFLGSQHSFPLQNDPYILKGIPSEEDASLRMKLSSHTDIQNVRSHRNTLRSTEYNSLKEIILSQRYLNYQSQCKS